jgi:hypothetical protein
MQPNEYMENYVLVKRITTYEVTYYKYQYEVIDTVQTSVCEKCYQERARTEPDELTDHPKGLFAKMKRWWREANRLQKGHITASFAFAKLLKCHPEITGRMDGHAVWGIVDNNGTKYNLQFDVEEMYKNVASATLSGPRYEIMTLDAWSNKVKDSREKG